MIGNKSVKLENKDADQYGRVVAYVWLVNINVNLKQIKEAMLVHTQGIWIEPI